ncbi:MAG TPA: site-2 protease family protein [Gammaproteobacteria bacterium]|jgi:Zn-dependent protease
MPQFSLVQKILLYGIPMLFAITVHEVAHGWVANRLGDPTARMLGRLTLNPIKHIDPIGTILIPGVLLAIGAPFLFGWAKPVPITPQNFKKPRTGMAWVAAAGPGSNALMALIWLAVCWITVLVSSSVPYIRPLYFMGEIGVMVNVVLGVLNLFPLPPLDGSRVLAGLLPREGARVLYRIEPYGLFIVAILLATGVLSWLLFPIMNAILNLLLGPIPDLPQ